MTSTTYKNERIKRRYFEYVRGPKGFSPKTVKCYEIAIWLWEDFSKQADFANFNQTSAKEFNEWLKTKKKARSEEKVGLSYCYDMLRYLKDFFEWLSKQSGYKSKINQTAIDYLNLSRAEVKMATQPKNVRYPSVEEVKTVIENIKGKTEVELRDRAFISLLFLTGTRISAIISLRMKSFDASRLVIDQDPKEGVATKNSKRIVTALIPLSYKEPVTCFLEWFNHLVEKGFKPDDPIFPATKVENGKENISYYNTGEVERTLWKSTTPARKILNKRFEEAGITTYNPHAFRHMLVKEIAKLPITEEQKKAVSQNFGHEHTGTTFGSYGYGKIEENRQIEIIKNIDFEGPKKEIQYVGAGPDEIKRAVAEAFKEAKDSKV